MQMEPKGAIQSKKKKNCLEISKPGSDPPHPPAGLEIYNLFFLSFWHHTEQLWKNSFFPLKNSKYLENFHHFIILAEIMGDPP